MVREQEAIIGLWMSPEGFVCLHIFSDLDDQKRITATRFGMFSRSISEPYGDGL